MHSINVKYPHKEQFHNISNAQYNWIKRHDLFIKDNTISLDDYNELPFMPEMIGYNNTMRIAFTPSQKQKLKYGHTFRIDPKNVDTVREGVVVKNLNKNHIDMLTQNKRTRRKSKITLTDAELFGTIVKLR